MHLDICLSVRLLQPIRAQRGSAYRRVRAPRISPLLGRIKAGFKRESVCVCEQMCQRMKGKSSLCGPSVFVPSVLTRPAAERPGARWRSGRFVVARLILR